MNNEDKEREERFKAIQEENQRLRNQIQDEKKYSDWLELKNTEAQKNTEMWRRIDKESADNRVASIAGLLGLVVVIIIGVLWE